MKGKKNKEGVKKKKSPSIPADFPLIPILKAVTTFYIN